MILGQFLLSMLLFSLHPLPNLPLLPQPLYPTTKSLSSIPLWLSVIQQLHMQKFEFRCSFQFLALQLVKTLWITPGLVNISDQLISPSFQHFCFFFFKEKINLYKCLYIMYIVVVWWQIWFQLCEPLLDNSFTLMYKRNKVKWRGKIKLVRIFSFESKGSCRRTPMSMCHWNTCLANNPSLVTRVAVYISINCIALCRYQTARCPLIAAEV